MVRSTQDRLSISPTDRPTYRQTDSAIICCRYSQICQCMCRSDPQQICALKIDALRSVDGGRLADGVAGMYVWLDFGPLSLPEAGSFPDGAHDARLCRAENPPASGSDSKMTTPLPSAASWTRCRTRAMQICWGRFSAVSTPIFSEKRAVVQTFLEVCKIVDNKTKYILTVRVFSCINM